MKFFATKTMGIVPKILFVCSLLLWSHGYGLAAQSQDNEIAGCATSTQADYTDGFLADDFDFTNVDIGENGNLQLQTGQQAINPEKIVIPFRQEVKITFLYEGAGYRSSIGWMLYKDAVDENGDFLGWDNIDEDLKKPLFRRIEDDKETGGCCGGGNGILDNVPTSRAQLRNFDDGTGAEFVFEGSGSVRPTDMQKSLGDIDGGQEIVFFLTADQDWKEGSRNSDVNDSRIYYTKTEWNPDTYGECTPGEGEEQYWLDEGNDKFFKRYNFDDPLTNEGGCNMEQNWLASPVYNRLDQYFHVNLEGDYDQVIVKDGQKPMPHVIVGAPANDPNQWILGWEDLRGGGDVDYNDMVFRIERKTGGTAALKPEEAISPESDNAYYTGVTIDVWDIVPSGRICDGQAEIKYFVSIDGGETWEEVREWTFVEETDTSGNSLNKGNIANSWVPGQPEATHRTARIDFAAQGLSGRELIWRAELISENEACVPEIINVELVGSVANNAIFSRSSPIIQTNVVYSGNYETPAADWPADERWLRGHLVATRVYDPADPSQTASEKLWDAGEMLAEREPSDRDIYFNDLTYSDVNNEIVGNIELGGDTFTGTLDHTIIQAGSLSVMVEGKGILRDEHTDVLSGSIGSGRVNRFNGEFTINLKSGVTSRSRVQASYTYYSSGGLTEFAPGNLDREILAIDDSYAAGSGFDNDFNEDGAVDDNDLRWLVNWTRGYKDGNRNAKAWPLGAIDHSAPAVAIPPGFPSWYPAIEKTALGESYRTFRENYSDRKTAVYVGSRSGMLHAFDGGSFRWGDNPSTEFEEYRGYFKWDNPNNSASALYGTGDELWAYIPSNLLSRLKNNVPGKGDPQGSSAYVDASPAIADVYVNNGWRTVLLSAQGNGGDSVFALDVTEPENPVFMWEFLDPDLFRSSSSPAVGQIGRIAVGGQERWAAFFVSGQTNCTTDEESEGSTYCYPSIFVIDIADGSVIERIFLDSESEGIGGIPSGQPAIMDFDNNGFIDRLYVGTAVQGDSGNRGYMYKVNLPDDGTGSITNCVINRDFITEDGDSVDEMFQPIHASPTVVKDGGVVKIFFGTSDSPYVSGDAEQADHYYFLGYIDSDGKGECGSADLDWFLKLPAGQRVFASAFAAAGRIYFGTSSADTEDPCEGFGLEGDGGNEGRLYVLDQDGGFADSDLPYVETGDLNTTPVVEDEHVYFKSPAAAADSPDGGVQSLGDGVYNNQPVMTGNPDTTRSWWREVY